MKTKVCFWVFIFVFLIVNASLAAVWPINNSSTPDQITSDFGPRITNSGAGFHWGIDVRARTPQTVHAILAGTITKIEINTVVPGPGNNVTIDGIRYLHLSENYASYEFRSNDLGTYIVVKNDQSVITKVFFKDPNVELETGLPPSTNTLSEGEIFAYSGFSGTSVAHLHVDKGQPGPNPLRDLPYTGVASRVTILEPANNQVSGKVKIVAGVESCQPSVGVCTGDSIPDLNEVKITVDNETIYNPKFEPCNFCSSKEEIKKHVRIGRLSGKGIYSSGVVGKETFVGIKEFTGRQQPINIHSLVVTEGGWRCGGETGQKTITVTAKDLKGETITASKTIEVMPDPDVSSCDLPDDNYSPSIFSFLHSDYAEYPPPDGGDMIVEITKRIPIALLKRGHYIDFEEITEQFEEEIEEVGIDFDTSIANDYSLLIIPSAALLGMEGSEVFKTRLLEYVKHGGTLLVLSQHRGYEYSILPVPEGESLVSGYGYTEDQGCQFASSYIDTWHQMLAPLNKSTPDINVDGYFTSIPSSATILLRRMKNGQPSAIMYPYSNGRVIATTLYSDFAQGTGQAFQEEIALIRDIISWAKSPHELPEVRPGGTVSLELSIQNPSPTDAISIKLHLIDSNRNTVFTQNIEQPLGAGQTITVPFTYTTLTTNPLGVWWVEYELLDSSGERIFYNLYSRRELLSGRFVVSNPPTDPAEIVKISLSIQSDAERYAMGSTATFTFIAFNNSDIEMTTIVKYEAGSQPLVVPARGSSSFTYSKIVNVSGKTQWMWADLYDENGRFLSSRSKNYWAYAPSVSVTVHTDKPYYAKGETVNLTLNLNNKQSDGYTTTLKVRVLDPLNASSYSDTIPIMLSANGTSTQSINFILPVTAQYGFYTVSIEAFDSVDRKIGGGSASFEVPRSQISVTPDLPPSITAGSTTISFALNNIGKIGVSSGIMNVSFKDPDGVDIFTGGQPFSIGVGQTVTLDFSAFISSLKFGDYTLVYSQSDETRTGSPTSKTIPNTANIHITNDKSSYRIRETANLIVNLSSPGKFNLDNATVTLSMPDANYTDSRTISLGINPSPAPLSYAIAIPETIISGMHAINVTIALSSGSSITQDTQLIIPESLLNLGYSGTTARNAGETINLTAENTGGVDTTYTTEALSITDVRGVIIYQGSVAGAVMAGERKTLVDIQVPYQTANGTVYLNVGVKDSKTGKVVNLSRAFEITGLTAALDASTDKEVYLKTETITGLSNIINGLFEIEGGSLKIAVSKVAAAGTGEFAHYLPKEGWWPFISLRNVATGPDGSVYIVDYGPEGMEPRIEKFDSNGNFIARWGSYGSGDGQFKNPNGVAVGTDGSVYVADTGNYRIQKFDSNGVFISMWGSYGSGDEQFKSPNGIAVGPDGSVYVVDTGNYRIQKFDGNGNFIIKWGSSGSGNGQFSSPNGITAGSDGDVYVADTGNHRIQKFDSSGNFITKWGSSGSGNGQFSSPRAVAAGSDGAVYVVDTGNARIQKFSSIGTFINKWGSYGSGNGQFSYPNGIALGPGDSIYVTEGNNQRIQKFDSSGTFISKWGSIGNGNGEFKSPNGIAIGSNGFVYVADTDNNRIQKFDSSGNFITKWGSYGSGDGQFSGPNGVAVGSDGSVYVVDTGNDRIQKFDGNGTFIIKWGSSGSGSGQFSYPYGIAAGADGTVYVADPFNYSIQKFDGNGTFITRWGSYGSNNGQFSEPYGVAAVPDGSVYVIDVWNYVQKFDSGGTFIARWGSSGSGDGQFSWPYGIAGGVDGSVYVADTDNHRIQKFDSNGNFVSKWGSSGSSDGQFSWPTGVAAGPDGSVYVADTGNHRIQRMAGGVGGTIFETTIPVNQPANITQEYPTSIGTLNTTGKLYLQAELKNILGQTISRSEYPFYMIEGGTLLLFSTDKTVYKPGETVTITGEVRNLASIIASELSLSLSSQGTGSGSQDLHTSTFDLPANGSHPFIVTATASAEGAFTLTGKITQNNSILAEISDQYEVAIPQVSIMISTPDVVGNEPFDIHVEMKNNGKALATLQVQSVELGDTGTTTIPPGETRIIEYTRQIAGDVAYTFAFTGDLNQTITGTVLYGLSTEIRFGDGGSGLGTYPEGKVSIPVIITNTGELDETLTVTFDLQPSALTQTKDYYVPMGGSVTETLYYNLTEGNYQITAGSQMPDASSQAAFEVRRENKAEMVVSTGVQAGEIITVTVNLTNLGYNPIEGSLQASLVSSEGMVVWSGSERVSSLSPQNSQPFDFTLNPSAISPGDYSVQVGLLNNSGQEMAARSLPLTIQGAVFQIMQSPPSQTFYPGQEATLTFRVKNMGNQEGEVELGFKAYDLIDSTRREWLTPGEEKVISFSFMLPDDLEEKDYFAEYELKDGVTPVTRGQVKYHLAGINLQVGATLDRQSYHVGDTAQLTIVVSQPPTSVGQNLFARVNYAGYESHQPFTLNESQTLAFDIPLTEITGEKLFYGIYYESGRSIHLNSLYVYRQGDVLTITTDKQVYNPGETVSITITGNTSGTLTLTAPGYSETSDFNGSATRYYNLPSIITAGTYFISAELLTTTSEVITVYHPFDIAGIAVKVKEASLDKGKYAPSDTLSLSLNIESNEDLPATLKSWVVNPAGEYTAVGENGIYLSSSEPLLLTNPYPLSTAASGIHRLVYGIYAGNLLLVSGSEAFDVGNAVLLGLSTDRTDYPTSPEPVNVTANMYGTGEAALELWLDGSAIQTVPVSLSGVGTLNIYTGEVNPGAHVLKAILVTGGLKSAKETTFTYAMSLIDSDWDGMPDQWEEANNLNPDDPSDALLDPDNDGLANLQEYQQKTNPNNSDTDNDQMPDGWEIQYGLNPSNPADAVADSDGDGFSNSTECLAGTDPLDPASSPNQPPVAIAGVDLQMECAGSSCPVVLDGSGSMDPDSSPGTQDDIAEYRWYEGYGTADQQLLSVGREAAITLSLGVHTVTLEVIDQSGAIGTDTLKITLDPARLSLFVLDKAEVDWPRTSGDLADIKLHGRLAMPVGLILSEVAPIATVALDLSGHVEILSGVVNFSVKGVDGDKWEFKANPSGPGIQNFSIHWKGARFDYHGAVHLKTEFIGFTETALSLDRKCITEPITLVVKEGEIVGMTASLDGSGSVLESSAPYEIDEDGEVTFTLPFELLPDMEITWTLGTQMPVSVRVGDYYNPATGKFEWKAKLNPDSLTGASRPATLGITVTLGNEDYPGSASVSETQWDKLSTKEWKATLKQ